MERPDQTSPYWNKDTIFVSFLMPVTLALQLGTGGQATAAYNKLRYDEAVAAGGYYRPANDDPKPIRSPSTADDIARVLNVLKPSVSSLARFLGVSRTAIYDWMNEKQISAANAAKLENFTKAADTIAAANLQMSPIVRGRKLASGATLFEAIASGVDGEKAALSLVKMLRDEADRRNRLTARFAGRRAVSEFIDDAPVISNE